MDTQIEIGIEIADFAKQEIASGEEPEKAFLDLIRQCLRRDAAWKAISVEKMEGVKPSGANKHVLDIYATELVAEQKYRAGDRAAAVSRFKPPLIRRFSMNRTRLGIFRKWRAISTAQTVLNPSDCK